MIGVYGANGFIGRHLVRRLAERREPLRAVSRKFDVGFTEPLGDSVEFIEADLRRPLAMASSLQDVETVVQLISTSSPGLKNDHSIADIQENVVPHVEFLRTCVQAGVKRYIYLSSGGTVYGPGAPVPTPETCLTNPISSHGLTKLMVEKYVLMHGRVDGLTYLILRVANAFGPGQVFKKGQGLIPALLDRRLKGLPARIIGDGTAMRDYIYIEDVVDAIEATLLLAGTPRHIVNIGSGEARSVNDVIEAVEEATGHHFVREYVDARATDVDIACLDISQAREVLGWTPRTPFKAAVRKTVGTGYLGIVG